MFPITISRTWRALVSLAAMIVVMLAWPLVAQHVTPSKPFLEKNAFYLR